MRNWLPVLMALLMVGHIAGAQAPARSVAVGGVQIVVPDCQGFQEVGDVPQLTAILRNVAPRETIQVALYTPNDISELLKTDPAAPVTRYVYIFAAKRLADEAQTAEKFQEFVKQAKARQQAELQAQATARGDANAPPKDLDPATGMKPGQTRAIPQLAEGTNYLIVPMYLCSPIPGGPSQPTLLVNAMSFVRVKDRMIFIHVISFYKSKADLDWVMATSAQWVPALITANAGATDAPTAKEGK